MKTYNVDNDGEDCLFGDLHNACIHATAQGLRHKTPSADLSLTVGIDARVLSFGPSMERGIGAYTRYHLTEIFSQKPDWKFVLFLEEFFNDELLSTFLSYPNVSWCLFDDPNQPQVDIFHIPDPMSMIGGYDSPFRMAPKVPLSVTFYDLIPLAMRNYHYDAWSLLAKVAFQKRLKCLEQPGVLTLTISEFTKTDLLKYCSIPPTQILPIMAGLNYVAESSKPSRPGEVEQMLSKYGICAPFFLIVGALDQHKNFPTAAQAFSIAKEHHPMKLVVVGGNADPFKQMYRRALEEQGMTDVIFTGFVENEELVSLYSAASALLVPSRYEGFGFPALEAMARGCPVIASNVTSLPEIIGDAGMLVDPDDVQGWAQSMLTLVREQGLRGQFIERGKKRAEQFSWKMTAEKTTSAWLNFLGKNSHTKQALSSSPSPW